LLIDTGAVESPEKMPLADTVMGLLPNLGASKMPLLVLHTHRHLDHRAGDSQFANRPGVQVVPALLEDVRKHFGFVSWPAGLAQIELGDRTIDVIPTPGHNPAHVAFYDRNTGLFFSGDFILPGRLLVDDIDEYRASARRVADFARSRPITHVLGGHIEMNREEDLFPWGSTHHPQERALPLTKEDLLSLPATLRSFNGFHTQHGKWAIINPYRQLMAIGAGALLALVALAWLAWRFFRRRKAARAGNMAT
jgi:glyoxylase-like metal-dependent hydrolase (beta-lactamase superfamily II)